MVVVSEDTDNGEAKYKSKKLALPKPHPYRFFKNREIPYITPDRMICKIGSIPTLQLEAWSMLKLEK